jgi:hypothetical protein
MSWDKLPQHKQDEYIRDAIFHLYADPYKTAVACGDGKIPLCVIQHAKKNYEQGVVVS